MTEFEKFKEKIILLCRTKLEPDKEAFFELILEQLEKEGFFLPQTFEEKANELAEFLNRDSNFWKKDSVKEARDFLKQKYGERDGKNE